MSQDPSQAVQAWYGTDEHWVSQNKDAAWAEYILIDQGALLDGKDVLNLGCLYPEDELRFASRTKSWHAIDFTPEVIERSRAMAVPGVVFLEMDMRRLRFADASFDVVLDCSSGDHLTLVDFRTALSEIARVIRPGGHFAIAYTNTIAMRAHGHWLDGRTEDYGPFGYSRGDTPAEMRAMLDGAGLRVVRAVNEELPRSGMLAVKA